MTTAPTTIHPTLADLIRPRTAGARAGLYNAALVFLASLFVAACAQIAIPMPSGVPITGQTFAVLLVGALLGPTLGAATLGLYMLEGLAGLPVFAEFHAGFQPLTMGYILAFIPAAALCGHLARRGWDRSVPRTILAMTLATGVIFAGGLAWLFAAATLLDTIEPSHVVAAGLWPYLPGAALKIVLAALLLPSAWRIIRR
jgi:biotin transport system substrate-specific component